MNTLFHYTTGQGIEGILTKKQIWCSNILFMNDPSEADYFESVVGEVIKDDKVAREVFEGLFDKSYHEAFHHATNKFVGSFSKERDSLSMWNYYAHGNGYNLGLDVDAILNDNRTDEYSIVKVEMLYSLETQKKRCLEFLVAFKNLLEDFKNAEDRVKNARSKDVYDFHRSSVSGILDHFNDRIQKLKVQFKHKAYEREQEVRLLISLSPGTDFTEDVRMSATGVFIPYIPLFLSLEEQLHSIMVHPLCGQIHLAGIERFISLRFPGKTKPVVDKSSIPFRGV